MKTVGDILQNREGVYHVKEDQTVLEVVQYMAERGIGGITVLNEDKRITGVFSERDLLKRVIAVELKVESTSIKDVMSTKLILCDKEMTYEAALAKMQKHKIRHLPVVSGDRFVGMISIRDLQQTDIESKDEEIKLLNDYVYYTPDWEKK